MPSKQTDLLHFRSEQLAIMYLTRRKDIAINKELCHDYGIDLLAQIRVNERLTGRMMGIEVKALAPSLPRNGRHKVNLDRPMKYDMPDLPFPVCLFVFTMEDDKGYWKWILKPDFHFPTLLLLKENDSPLIPLTDAEIDHIIFSINEWYDFRSLMQSNA